MGVLCSETVQSCPARRRCLPGHRQCRTHHRRASVLFHRYPHYCSFFPDYFFMKFICHFKANCQTLDNHLSIHSSNSCFRVLYCEHSFKIKTVLLTLPALSQRLSSLAPTDQLRFWPPGVVATRTSRALPSFSTTPLTPSTGTIGRITSPGSRER